MKLYIHDTSALMQNNLTDTLLENTKTFKKNISLLESPTRVFSQAIAHLLGLNLPNNSAIYRLSFVTFTTYKLIKERCSSMAASVLFDAASHGRVDVLLNSVKDDPSILAEFRLASLGESLLHVATKAGQLNFMRELLRIDPQMSQELNKDGLRPLDVAVIMGNLRMVKEILSFNHNLCRLKGKNGRTALHYAASKGRVDVIDALLHTCHESIEDVTVYGETALHLAVKANQFDAFSALVEWLWRLGKKSIVNLGDGDGDTVLHLSVSTKQHECVELLVGEKSSTMKVVTEVNIRNLKGLTALDVLDVQDSYDTIISRTLESAGAVRAPDSASLKVKRSKTYVRVFKSEKDLASPQHDQDWFKYFKFQKQRDSPSDTRNALLVVAALIATVCFQSGVSPPDGTFATSPGNNQSRNVFSSPPPGNNQNSNVISTPPPPAFNPGAFAALAGSSAIVGSYATSYLFLFSNSLGLTASTCIIIYLTSDFPFQRELHMAMYSMMCTYGFAVSVMIRDLDKDKKDKAYILMTVAFVLPFALRWLPRWGKRAWKYCRRSHDTNTPLPRDK